MIGPKKQSSYPTASEIALVCHAIFTFYPPYSLLNSRAMTDQEASKKHFGVLEISAGIAAAEFTSKFLLRCLHTEISPLNTLEKTFVFGLILTTGLGVAVITNKFQNRYRKEADNYADLGRRLGS